ncbi:MAG: hypothetical protein A2270_02805 [Elusimicrobia bacterium RIFOXYA12_FULL_51_18]|nr:MAG: hypothetical protein A2270_02805 [Elusimicrobia bacterium RIFOXYA12_FULL_51_18]OGS28322.1 MAG: hypothetical protein A2218_00015 [Elusimicrobia bacterium RIFOXYA2_FULL_53_38]
MKKENELKGLLDRLKGEVRQSSGPSLPRPEEFHDRFEGAPRAVKMPASGPYPGRSEKFPVSGRTEFQRPERIQAPAGANIIWSENKETMLFGILASLVTIMCGILAGLDYIVLIGAVSFMLFSFITVLVLFSYCLNFKRKNSEEGLLGERVDQLSRRLEALTVKGVSSQPRSLPEASVKDKELEQKVEELRMLMKSLAKAVERGNGGERF